MAIGFRAAGTTSVGAASGTITPGLPAGTAAGDLLLFVINNKAAANIDTPSGWAAETNNSTSNTVGGTTTTDSGQNRVTVFWKEAGAGESAPTALVTGGGTVNSFQAYVLAYTKGAGESWDTPVMAAGSSAAASSTSYSATGNATVAVAAGDWAFHVTGFNGDAGTPGSRTFSWGGATLGTYGARVTDVGTTQGGDLRMDVGDAPYSSGTASSAPSMSRTWTSGNAAFSGASIFVRLRLAAAGETHTTTGTATATASASGSTVTARTKTATASATAGASRTGSSTRTKTATATATASASRTGSSVRTKTGTATATATATSATAGARASSGTASASASASAVNLTNRVTIGTASTTATADSAATTLRVTDATAEALANATADTSQAPLDVYFPHVPESAVLVANAGTAVLAGNGQSTATLAGNGQSTAVLADVAATAVLQTT